MIATIPMYENIARLPFDEMPHFLPIVNFDQMCVEINNTMWDLFTGGHDGILP